MKKQVLMRELWGHTNEEILDCFTRAQLRAFAKEHGIKSGGYKADVIYNIIYSDKPIDIEFIIGV